MRDLDTLRKDFDAPISFSQEVCSEKLTITPQEDGNLIVILPSSLEQEAIRWILGEGGNVEVLEP